VLNLYLLERHGNLSSSKVHLKITRKKGITFFVLDYRATGI